MQSYSKNKTMEVEVIIEGPLHEPFLIIVCVNDTKWALWMFKCCVLSFCLGLLRKLWSLFHGTKPAAPAYCGSLYTPAAAGLAHPHCHEDGAADVHEQMHLKCFLPHWPSFPCQPCHLPKGEYLSNTVRSFDTSLVCPHLVRLTVLWAGGHLWCPLMDYLSVLKFPKAHCAVT